MTEFGHVKNRLIKKKKCQEKVVTLTLWSMEALLDSELQVKLKVQIRLITCTDTQMVLFGFFPSTPLVIDVGQASPRATGRFRLSYWAPPALHHQLYNCMKAEAFTFYSTTITCYTLHYWCEG